MKFFGGGYPYDWDEPKVDVPVGAICGHCGEAIRPDDGGCFVPGLPKETIFHHACFLRGVIGSVAHQQRRCSCFIRGSTETDDPALTPRQAAEAARAYFYEMNP